ncbi:MAG: hypothetical protein HYV07_14390 [Deltaproteobacteria bacterium]|nr:hypothetical protein [Deltaproteobacteria bacterium]
MIVPIRPTALRATTPRASDPEPESPSARAEKSSDRAPHIAVSEANLPAGRTAKHLRPEIHSGRAPRFPLRSAGDLERVGAGSVGRDVWPTLSSEAKRALSRSTPGGERAILANEPAFGVAVGRALVEAFDRHTPDRVTLLDELLGVAVFAGRAGRSEFLRGLESELPCNELEAMKAEVSLALPGQVLAVVVGAGAMGIGLSKLIGHAIRPGGHSWRDRVVIATPFPEEERAINVTGKFQEGSSGFANVSGPLNFAGGPMIEAISLQKVESVVGGARSVLLMVPSKALPEVIQRVGPHLPPSVPVVEFTKGVTPDTQLPRESLATELRKLGRSNPVVTLGGFCPGQDLHAGKKVTLSIASAEPAAAKRVGQVLSGGHSAYVQLVPDAHPLATELAGALKNVVALGVGARSVSALIARSRPPRAESALALIERVVREAVDPSSTDRGAFLAEPVRDDAVACCTLHMATLESFVAGALKAQITTDTRAIDWLRTELLPHRVQLAPTRNIIVGVVSGLVDAWDPSGDKLDLSRILRGLELTMEGVSSLPPLRGWFAKRGLSIPSELEDVYSRFEACSKPELPSGSPLAQQLAAMSTKPR